jgi:hypothetical protein
MKKIFLSFVSLWSSSLLAYDNSGTVNTSKEYNVKIGGKLNFSFYSGANKHKHTYLFTGKFLNDLYQSGQKLNTYELSSMAALNSSRFTVSADRCVAGVKYSFNLALTGDQNSTKSVREIYLKAETDQAGAFIFGNTKGVEDRFVACPSDFLVGSGGTDGSFGRFVNMTTQCTMSPSLLGDPKESTKVCWISPRTNGFQIGASFTPSTQHYGEANMNTAYADLKKPYQPFDINSLALGINYLARFGEATLNLSFVHLRGQSRGELPDRPLLARANTRVYDVGCVLSLGPWVLGAEYINNGKSHRFSNNYLNVNPVIDGVKLGQKDYIASKAGKNWILNTGIGYITKTAGVTFSYLHSERRTGFVTPNTTEKSVKSVGNSYVLSAEYYLAPGLSPYIEGGIYTMKNPAWAHMSYAVVKMTELEFVGVPSNKAKVILTGIKLQF